MRGRSFAGAHPVPLRLALAQNLSQQAQNLARPVGFADIVEKVKPAVISVRVKVRRRPQTHRLDDELAVPARLADGALLPPLRHAGRRRRACARAARPPLHHGQGSGFFISADGYAVTNNHVVDKAESVEVTTDDGKTYTAKVIGTDPRTDLALIKVEGGTLPLRQARRQAAAHRRLGARGRQSVRPRRHRDRRHRVGARPRHRRRPL